MPNVQPQFIAFHEAIQLTNLDENTTLRQKRDVLLDKLRAGLAKKFEGQTVPTFSHRNQGSYSIGTGIKPTNGRDFDIDVALLFNIDAKDFPDPVVVKGWVQEVLDAPPHNAEIKRPCVTVQYTAGGADAYHVDFAVYACQPVGSIPQLATGFVGSSPELKAWVPSDFVGLQDKLAGRFADPDEHQQYRRVIRYLKRWKDVDFSASGESAPKGIGLACAAYNWFQPVGTTDAVSRSRSDDDLSAILRLVDGMLMAFRTQNGERRLRTPLPAAPHGDPFERMSAEQMSSFEAKLKTFRDCLRAAEGTADPVKSCAELARVFGVDFPVPSAAESAAATAAAAVVATGHYA